MAIDTNLFLQLQDLTMVLAKTNCQLDFTYGSYIDVKEKRVTASTLWEVTQPHIQKAGYRTDIYLRTLGTIHSSDLRAFSTFWKVVQEFSLRNFASQLLTLLEDVRLEDKIQLERPGTREDFVQRTSFLKHYFTKQLATNRRQTLLLDELFCMIYLTL